MTPLDRRLRRYATFAGVHAAIVVAVLAAPVPAWAAGFVFVGAIPFMFAWGHFQVDLIRNAHLDEGARSRWRSLFWLLPWSMTVYWFRYVRPREEPA